MAVLPALLFLVHYASAFSYKPTRPDFSLGPDENFDNYLKGIRQPNATNTVRINDENLSGTWTWTVNVTDVANSTRPDTRITYTSWSFSWPNTTARLYQAIPNKAFFTYVYHEPVNTTLSWTGSCESALGKVCVSELTAMLLNLTGSQETEPYTPKYAPPSCVGSAFPTNDSIPGYTAGFFSRDIAVNDTYIWFASDAYTSSNMTAYQNALNLLQIFMFSANGKSSLYCNRASGTSAAASTSSTGTPGATAQAPAATTSKGGSARTQIPMAFLVAAMLLYSFLSL